MPHWKKPAKPQRDVGGLSSADIELNKAQKKIIRIANTKPKHAHAEPLLKGMNCLQLDDLYTQKVIDQLHKIRTKQAPSILHDYVEWHPEDHRRWYHIKTKVKLTRTERQLPKYHQITAWNNYFHSINNFLITDHESTKKLTKAIKARMLNEYYTYCDLNNCYSCRDQKRLDDERKAIKQAIKEEEAKKKARIARIELEEEYWYLIPEEELQYHKPNTRK